MVLQDRCPLKHTMSGVHACDGDASLPDTLCYFYVQFVAQNNQPAWKTTPSPTDQIFSRSTLDVSTTLSRDDPWQAAGHDNIPGRVLRTSACRCPDQHIQHFSESGSLRVLQNNYHHPRAKKNTVSCLNDYRPIALTPVIIKCIQKLVMKHMNMDPFQLVE